MIRAALPKEPFIKILANDIDMDDNSLGTGLLKKDGKGMEDIRTGMDKLKVFVEASSGPEESVYIGDSSTDLLCLLEASVGVIMGRNEGLADLCRRFNVEVVEGVDYKPDESHRLLYRFDDWNQLLESKLLKL